jgi:myosin-5
MDILLFADPIMEAFGSAKTSLNDSSSRFGKFVQVYCGELNEIKGARLTTYLLEKGRVTFSPSEESNFHVFYLLCYGSIIRDELSLRQIEEYRYLEDRS